MKGRIAKNDVDRCVMKGRSLELTPYPLEERTYANVHARGA